MGFAHSSRFVRVILAQSHEIRKNIGPLSVRKNGGEDLEAQEVVGGLGRCGGT